MDKETVFKSIALLVIIALVLATWLVKLQLYYKLLTILSM